MILRMFSIKDVKMNLFMNPMFFTARGHAVRVVSDEVNRVVTGSEPATSLQSHPEDCLLFEVGEFDTESGVISVPKEPTLVCHCKDLATGRS